MFLYDGKPEYFAITVRHPKSGIKSIADLKGKAFAINSKYQTIELLVTRNKLKAGADYHYNRDAMIADGLIKTADSMIFWTSDPLPNDAIAASATLAKDAAFVAKLQAALTAIGPQQARTPNFLPPSFTGFMSKNNGFYRPIRDAGLASGQ